MAPLFNPSSGGAATTVTTGGFLPPDSGLVGWTFDSCEVQSGTVMPTAGLLTFARIKIPASAAVTNILLHVASAGVTLTAGQCFASLHNGSGALLGAGAVTADQSTNWQSGGLKVMPLTVAQAATGPYVYVCWWFNGTTGPSISRAVNSSSAILNAGLSAPNFRYGTADTGLTTTPPNNIGTQTGGSTAFWVGLS